jgi:hypothetical protein
VVSEVRDRTATAKWSIGSEVCPETGSKVLPAAVI